MRVHDLLSAFERLVERDPRDIDAAGLEALYVGPHRAILKPLLDDIASWTQEPFLERVRRYDRARGLAAVARARRRGYPPRARGTLRAVELFFDARLEGDLVLFGGFGRMDGYARFDRGKHVVYRGLAYDGGLAGTDTSEGDRYFDILIAHELGHVVREGRGDVWEAYGERPDMTHDEFVERVPFEEHMLGEGLSTALSEAIYPGAGTAAYLYYEPGEMAWCEAHEKEIAATLRPLYGTRGEHYAFYAEDAVAPGSPERVPYYWGYRLVKNALAAGSDLRTLFASSAADLLLLAGEPAPPPPPAGPPEEKGL